jgi:predicted phage terminase large subunit-like protein
LDDPQNLDDAYSETQLEKDYYWLTADVLKAGEPCTNFMVIGTALHASCLVCRLEHTPGWQFRRFASLITEPIRQELWAQWREHLYRHDDPERDAKAHTFYLKHQTEMDEGAEVLWPERFPLEALMLKRFAEGERAFASEEQGIATPPGESEWPTEYFNHAAFWFDEWPKDLLLHGYALDPSKGNTDKASDYQAFVRLGRDRHDILYVEAWLEKCDTKVLSDFLVELFRKNPAELVALEANGFQELLRIPIMESCQRYQLRLPLVTMVNVVAKPVRIRRLTPYLAQRCIRFKRGSRGTQLLVQQLQMFRVPLAQGAHDDGPDALELAIRALIKLSRARVRNDRDTY